MAEALSMHCYPLHLVSVTESGAPCRGDLPDGGGGITFPLPISTSSPLPSSFSLAIALLSMVFMTDTDQFGN